MTLNIVLFLAAALLAAVWRWRTWADEPPPDSNCERREHWQAGDREDPKGAGVDDPPA